ncbi:aminoglycoside phosphotransferase family protein [Cribrihabitans pelagius]|uniref:aminoglycoside phosphotransferase family protein n=1 Tax=Cribrihabitans pelagius TaxID=1765746 RepID=UPI003B5A956A
MEDVAARTRALWPQAAASLGVPAAGASFRRMQVHSSKEDRRCALEVRSAGGERFVLRAEFAGSRPGRFRQYLERHKAAADGLKPVPGVSAPGILWHDPQKPFVLMEFAPGDTAFRELAMTEYGIGGRGDVLRRIGHAVAALHRVSEVGGRKFWPKTFLAKVSGRAVAVRDGRLRLPKPNKFLGLCAYLHRAGRRARGHSYAGAVEHGDLHLRNILMSGETVSFIDFSNHKEAFPQRDLVKIWLANCPDQLANGGRKPGYGLVGQADWDAFQDGYGAELTSDLLFRFFFALQVYSSWLRLTGPAWPLEAKSMRLAEALVRVYESLLADEPG